MRVDIQERGNASPVNPSARKYAPEFVDGHIAALRLVVECGLTASVRRWLSDPVIQFGRTHGSDEQKVAIQLQEVWLAATEAHELRHGNGTAIKREHPFVQLLRRVSHVPDLD